MPFQTYLVMLACYTEVMNLGYKVTGAKHLKPLAWALFIVQQYSFLGDKLLRYIGINEEVLPQKTSMQYREDNKFLLSDKPSVSHVDNICPLYWVPNLVCLKPG